jgi:hypothetical protein
MCGGGQSCSFDIYMGYNSVYQACGYNNWRHLYLTTQGVSACWSTVFFDPYGASDNRCGDVFSLHVASNGSYSRLVLHQWCCGTLVHYVGTATT